MVPRFLANLRGALLSAQAALDSRDFDQIRRVGHDARGAGGGYGFDEISTIGEALEQAARAADSRAVRLQLDRLSAFLISVEQL